MMLLVEAGARPPPAPQGPVELRRDAGHRSTCDEAVVDGAESLGAGSGAGPPDVSRLLANRLIAGLDGRPFRPTAEQLAWVWGGELVRGEAAASRARIAAGRYAALFTDHVVQDIMIDGAPGAYARIWLCARLAFIESVTSGRSEGMAGAGIQFRENEGAAS